MPDHWTSQRLGILCDVRLSGVDKHSNPEEVPVSLCNYTDAYNNERITADLDFMEATATPKEIERLSLLVNDVLVTKDSETPDDIGIPALVSETVPGVVCGYHLALLRPQGVEASFLAWALQGAACKSQFRTAAKGITRYALGADELHDTLLVLPPADEQRAIARVLDEETVRIDELVVRKQRFVELLREERAAVITRAVTKGLDPSVPMKPSGIDWLGSIPVHWDMIRLRFLLSDVLQGFSPQALDVPPEPEEWGVLKLGAVSQGRFNPRNAKTVPPHQPFDGSLKVLEGDLLVSRSNTPRLVGDAALVRGDPGRLIACDLIYRLRLVPGACNPEFVEAVLISKYGRRLAEMDAVGSSNTMVKLSQEDVRRWRIPLPPMAEQASIANHLKRETARLDAMIGRAKNGIALLKEYRSALITAAVTGQIDVRGEV